MIVGPLRDFDGLLSIHSQHTNLKLGLQHSFSPELLQMEIIFLVMSIAVSSTAAQFSVELAATAQPSRAKRAANTQ
jgi:hypothetical protein